MDAPAFEQEVKAAVQQVIERHGKTREELIAILSDINHIYGYIPAAAMREIKQQMSQPEEGGVFVSTGQLYGLASFYDMLSTEARGRHVIKFCENAPCHVVGGKVIWDALREKLNINHGGTTPDHKWTLVTTSCIGLCSVGPVLLIDDDLYGNVRVEQLPEILGRYE